MQIFAPTWRDTSHPLQEIGLCKEGLWEVCSYSRFWTTSRGLTGDFGWVWMLASFVKGKCPDLEMTSLAFRLPTAKKSFGFALVASFPGEQSWYGFKTKSIHFTPLSNAFARMLENAQPWYLVLESRLVALSSWLALKWPCLLHFYSELSYVQTKVYKRILLITFPGSIV